jgi:hypothetical protein
MPRVAKTSNASIEDGELPVQLDARPDTPEPKTPQQAKARLREMWGELRWDHQL